MARPLTRLFSHHLQGPLRASFGAQTRQLPHKALTRSWPFRRPYATGESGPKPRPGQNTLKVWPFVAITLAGSAAYVLMVRARAAEMAPAVDKPKPAGHIAAPSKSAPTFSSSDVTVLFVLGGPGAGKGTQCANLVRDYNFAHLSAGDLLRSEQDRPGSEFGELIKSCIKDGQIVPMEVTVQLLENAMVEKMKGGEGKGKFLIDGFPRKMDQALKFEEAVCEAKFVLFFDCPEEEMEKRLLKRGKTSGRADDNEESIRKRFKVFEETSMPVVDFFSKQGRVVSVLATKAPDDVYKDVKVKLEERLGKEF